MEAGPYDGKGANLHEQNEMQQSKLKHGLKRRHMTLVAIGGGIDASLLVGRRMRDIMSTDLVTTYPLIASGTRARDLRARLGASPGWLRERRDRNA